MDLASNSNYLVEVDNDKLQTLQDAFCKANDMYMVCISKRNGQMTDFSGDKAEEEFVDANFSSQLRREIMDSFIDGDAENVIERAGTLDYILYRGVAIRGKEGIFLGVWLCFALAAELIPDDVFISSEIKRTSRDQFEKSISLLETVTKSYFSELTKITELKQDILSGTDSIKEMAHRLKKNEIMTDIIKMMESENSFAKIAEDVFKEIGVYLDCSHCCLIQLSPDDLTVDMVAEWTNAAASPFIARFQGIRKDTLPFMNGKPYTISSDTSLTEPFIKFFEEYEIKAGVFLPISVNASSGMYICILSVDQKRNWTVEELQFINDVKRILTSVLIKRIDKNSLASSYSALESILKNAGYGVAVSDVTRRETLYLNDTFKKMFSDEIDRLAIEDILFDKDNDLTELNGYSANGSGKWYDISFSSIKWVDGRVVRITTFYDITELRAYQKRVERQALEDSLTGLFNRQACEKAIAAEYHYAVSTDSEFAVLMIDMDDFANINEGLGNKCGDMLLKFIARSINDISLIKGKVYRAGGDEFAVLVDHEIYDQLDFIVKRIMNLFDNPWVIDNQEYYCTMSMGAVRAPSDSSDFSGILNRLNIALHEAKNRGKNRFEFYDQNSDNKAPDRLKLERAMRKAVEDDCKEFEVYYQPIIELREGTPICCGAEALVRWNSAELGFLTPEQFIPLAEYLGLIMPIGSHVLYEAAKSCKHWNDFGHPDYKINVNLSVIQLTKSNVVEEIRTVLNKTAIDPHNLTLEVTESMAINELDRMYTILDDIRSLGCRVALDDFGTGYSSINHLRVLPIDTIKIDKVFVQDINSDNFCEAFIKSVSELAQTLKMDVCVEGVELEAQLEMLRKYPVNLIQGYLFNKPLSLDSFEDKYIN